MTADEDWLASVWPFVRAHVPLSTVEVLEVGCGPLGGFVPALRRDGHKATGVDPRAPSATCYQQSNFEQYKPALTAREIEVLELLAKGMRNKEIGATLHITEETVRAHIRSIFLKLNVHDRTAALAEALRRGIVRVGYVAESE